MTDEEKIADNEETAKQVGRIIERAIFRMLEANADLDDPQYQRRVVVFLPPNKEKIDSGTLHRYTAILVNPTGELKPVIINSTQMENDYLDDAVYEKEAKKYVKFIGIQKMMNLLATKIYGY